MIRSVAKMMKSAGKTSQIIVATHSALLLNAFELDDILVFEKMTGMKPKSYDIAKMILRIVRVNCSLVSYG